MNFTGQVSRRNVNMGSRVPRKTRDSILKNAEIERIRRQKEKAEINAAMTVQKYARRRLSNSRLFGALVRDVSNVDEALTFITLFRHRLYTYLEPNEFIVLIVQVASDKKILPFLSTLLGDVQDRKTSAELDSLLIHSLKPLDTPDAAENHIHNKIRYVQNCPYTISKEQMQNLLALQSDNVFRNFWYDMFFVDKMTVTVQDNYLLLVHCLFSLHSLDGFDVAVNRNTSIVANYVVNLIEVSDQIRESETEIFVPWLVIICSNLHASITTKPIDLSDSLQHSLIRCHDWVNDDYLYWDGIHYLLRQSSPTHRNTMFMSFLTTPSLRNDLVDIVCANPDNPSLKPCSICVQMFNFYIPLSPDDHLFKSVISRDRLQLLSMNIARLLIRNIMDVRPFINAQDLEIFVEFMWNLVYLDSRVKFLNEGTATFWKLVPDELHDLNIRKEILDFELYYRESLVKIEELDLSEDEMFDRKKLIDQSIKSQYLDDLKYKRRGASNKIRKLDLLFNFPFMLKFFERVDYFNDLIQADKERVYSRSSFYGLFPGENRLRATIRREFALEDAYNAYGTVGEQFKEKLSIQFVNEFGPEAGIDGGGITKEFLQTLVQEGFIKGKYSLFETTSFHKIFPSRKVSPQNLKYISFMGKVLGKCLYENILVDVEFADFFLKKLLNVENSMNVPFNDLYSLDPIYYQNLMKLLSMSDKELDYMDLYFEVPETQGDKRIPLIKDGLTTKVTQRNVFDYITRVSHYKLNLQLYTVTSRFISGLSYMIPSHWLRMFTSYELKTLISGSEKDFDLEDLRKHTEYGGFSEDSITIKHFWQVLGSFTPDEKRKFLKFVFSVPTAPLKGFHSLSPLFGIRNAGDETDRLPTASTCINLLKLPDYKNYGVLRSKLLIAINSDSRFELS